MPQITKSNVEEVPEADARSEGKAAGRRDYFEVNFPEVNPYADEIQSSAVPNSGQFWVGEDEIPKISDEEKKIPKIFLCFGTSPLAKTGFPVGDICADGKHVRADEGTYVIFGTYAKIMYVNKRSNDGSGECVRATSDVNEIKQIQWIEHTEGAQKGKKEPKHPEFDFNEYKVSITINCIFLTRVHKGHWTPMMCCFKGVSYPEGKKILQYVGSTTPRYLFLLKATTTGSNDTPKFTAAPLDMKALSDEDIKTVYAMKDQFKSMCKNFSQDKEQITQSLPSSEISDDDYDDDIPF